MLSGGKPRQIDRLSFVPSGAAPRGAQIKAFSYEPYSERDEVLVNARLMQDADGDWRLRQQLACCRRLQLTVLAG